MVVRLRSAGSSTRRRPAPVWDDRGRVRLKLWVMLALYLCAAVVSRG